jgi:hypothetical protein
MSLVKLQALLYLASLEAVCDGGKPIFDEPFYKSHRGAWVRSVSEDWLRRYRRAHARADRRMPALRRRVRRWAIQEAAKGLRWPGKINMPGGWGSNDARAQGAGIMDAARVSLVLRSKLI